MQKQFLHDDIYCSLETSILAKKKGFLEICTSWYNFRRKEYFYSFAEDFEIDPGVVLLSHFKHKDRVGIPTKSQLINWFNSMGFEFYTSSFAEEADINILFQKFLNLL
jgi:hypothetical protein